MDRKRGYTREKDDKAINEKDLTKMLTDYKLAREQDDIENMHEKLFENGRMDLEKFNAIFDALHKDPDEMIVHKNNPDAWNTMDGLGSNFSTVNDYENLFTNEDENISTTLYGSIKYDPN